MRTIIDTQKKLIHDQEERIKNLEKIVALKEEEMNLYKSRWIVLRALGTTVPQMNPPSVPRRVHNTLKYWKINKKKSIPPSGEKCPENVPNGGKNGTKLNC